LDPLIAIGQTWVLSILINYLVKGNVVFYHLYILTGISILMAAFPFLFSRLENYFEMMTEESVVRIFDVKRSAKRADIDIATQESPEFNDLNNKLAEGAVNRLIEIFIIQNNIISSVMSVVAAAVIIISFKWWLIIAVLIAIIPNLVVSIYYGAFTYKLFSQQTINRRDIVLYRNFFYDLPSLIDVKLYNLKERFLKKFEGLYIENSKQRIQLNIKRGKWQALTYFLAYIGIAVPIIWFIKQAAIKMIAIGTLTFAISTIERFRSSLSTTFTLLGNLYEDNLYVNDFFKFLAIAPKIESTDTPLKIKNNPQLIEFKNVSFSYPNSKKLILKHLNLTIRAGEHLAIVGANGAGKTTLIKLLCRFYDPTEGEILIDGQNLKDINLKSWYSYLGLLPQDYANYQLTVKEAIAIGGDMLDIERVYRAGKMSEADTFIKSYPDKYEQRLGRTFHNGREPSIGQWQKLAIARLFYRNPYIYILDEPTSSVDAQSEIKIFERLNKLAKDKVAIFISHGFTTVRQANKICVIENGVITEMGTHQELLANKKTYANLFQMQARSYEE
ncbi:MAG TPA: ABC transporter ATP-binding protein, partial [Candidatus Paceibacterota bacterium]|nr:ABC transporter ATP-binding protein [Candidatus Paceibacterota bacterium]